MNTFKQTLLVAIITIASGLVTIITFINDHKTTSLITSCLCIAFILGFFLGRKNIITFNGSMKKIKVFNTCIGTKNDTAFYAYFNSKIEAAKRDIYITGNGFSCIDAEYTKMAYNYIRSITTALQNDVNVVYFQTKYFVSQKWLTMVDEILQKYPNNFSLYICNSTDMIYSCTIDPYEAKGNLVEIMLSLNKTVGLKNAPMVGLAVFIEEDIVLTQNVTSRILSIKNDINTVEVTHENIQNFTATEASV